MQAARLRTPCRSACRRPFAAARTPLRVSCAVKLRADKNVVCSKTLVARPQDVDKVVALCEEVTAFSREQARLRESGILSFECVRDTWEPTTFHFYERYASNVHLGRHNTSEPFERFMQQVIGRHAGRSGSQTTAARGCWPTPTRA